MTYSAALLRMIECARLVGDTFMEKTFAERLALNSPGMDSFLAPTGDCERRACCLAPAACCCCCFRTCLCVSLMALLRATDF